LGAVRRSVGALLRRVEDPRLLTGRAAYLDDLRAPGLLHAAFVRSPHAHARIVRADCSAAERAPGVRLVLDGPRLASLARPLCTRIGAPGCRRVTRPHLAIDQVRFVGEAVALVVADDVYLARDAAELVAVDYEPLPPVGSVAAALAPGAPPLHDGAPGNVLFEREHATGPDVDDVFDRAEVVVGVTVRHPRITGLAIENRGILADFDAAAGGLTVWSSTQAPHTLRAALAECLGPPPERIRVVVPDVGGGFGTKAQIFPEEIAVAAAAVALGRPVKWAEDRLENLQAASHARDTRIEVELAAAPDGRVLAMRADVVCGVGAYGVHPYGPILEPLGTASMIPGPYDVPRYRYRTRAVALNASPEGACRGVGIVAAALAHERLMDELAQALGLDPAEVRRRNLVPPDRFPYTSAAGHVYDSGRYHDTLERALAAANYDELRAEQAKLRAGGRLLGIGLACYTEYTGMGSGTYQGRGMLSVPGHETAWLRLEPGGRLTASVSLPAIGQGLQTTLAQLLADEFEIPVDHVALLAADTALAPEGSGTFASRGAVVGAGSLRAVADRLKERLRPLAADLLEATPADVEFAAGGARVRGVPERRVGLRALAEAAWEPLRPPLPEAGRGEGLLPPEVTAPYDPPDATFSNATHLAAVEVDPETGLVGVRRYVVVEDCGPLINPTIVEGQVHGATAQGIGGALFEELVYDGEGQLLTSSLMDYLIPGSAELPNVHLEHVETPSPLTIGGYKGVGEGGTVGAPAAILNAVADALAPLGATVTELPLTPERVRAAIRVMRDA
jgi:aerobic carbon-monoxide dehydrogenase large subunit